MNKHKKWAKMRQSALVGDRRLARVENSRFYTIVIAEMIEFIKLKWFVNAGICLKRKNGLEQTFYKI